MGKSLISRTYGLFKIWYPGMKPIYVQVQKNTLILRPDNKFLAKFDLKGSKYKRKVIKNLKFRNT